MNLNKWIEVFRAGEYPQGKFTNQEIDEVVETYSPDTYNAPMQPGHSSDWKNDSRVPALGFIGKLKRIGESLYALPSKVAPELSEHLEKGHYSGKSIELYQPEDPNNPTPGKWHFKALAWLGAKPPAVKGLSLEYAEFVPGGIEMAELPAIDAMENAATKNTLDTLEMCFASCLKSVQDCIDLDDTDQAKQKAFNAVYDCYDQIQSEIGEHFSFVKKLESMEETEMSEKSFFSKVFEIFKPSKIQHSEKESIVDTAKEKEFSEKIAQLEAEKKVLSDANAKAEADKLEFAENQKKQNAKATVLQFMESITATGKRKKLEDMGFPAVAEGLILSGVQEFGEGEGKTTVKSFLQKYVDALPEFPKGEQANEDVKNIEMSEDYAHAKYAAPTGASKVVAFAEEFVRKNPDRFSGTLKQKIAQALQGVTSGEIKMS